MTETRQQQTEEYFTDENEVMDRRTEKVTPSGRHKLITRYYSTRKGCWNYSRGTFYRISDGKEICDIKRNYSSFYHSFLTKNNQEWVVTGRSYMSQTIINLDTGEIFEPEGDQYNGGAFCWIGATLLSDERTLMVEGCVWACPYEYRFYDFSDPSKGWPELKLWENDKETYLCILHGDYPKDPDFNQDGTITIFETSDFYLPLGKYDNDIELEELEALPRGEMDKIENWRVDINKKITLQRQEDKMVITNTWVSPEEQERERRRAEVNERWKAWRKKFTTTDPLYLRYLERLKDPDLTPETYEGTGVTYLGWAPGFDKKERRWCRRILKSADDQPYTVDLGWAVETGPIKLTIYKDGNSHDEKYFSHSAEAMNEAFDYTLSLLKAE